MVISLSHERVRLLRLRAQRLVPRLPDVPTDVANAVKQVCGIQAQDAPAAMLAVRIRSTGLTAAGVEQALVQERTVVRTWGQRGTLHLLATEDLSWLLSLFGPVFIASSRRRYAELGLDEDTLARGVQAIRDVLANTGPLTRDELVEQLANHGIQLTGQARPYLLSHAALKGIVCFGPDRGTKPTYVLLGDWIDRGDQERTLSEDAAHTELALRYLKAYGLATPEDQARWSGLPMNKIRAAWQRIANQLQEVEIDGSPAWMLQTSAAWLDELSEYTPVTRLLPSFDTYLLGYQNRDLIVPPQHAKRINAGGGMLHPALSIDGYVVGTWKIKRGKNHMDVVAEPFDRLRSDVYAGIEAEVVDLARFLDIKATLSVMGTLRAWQV